MITAVTFDCWGTLITDSGYQAAMAQRTIALSEACDLEPDRASDLLDRAWRAHHHAWLDAKQYGSPGIARFCFDELGIDDDAGCARLADALEECGRLGTQRALVGAAESLRGLRDAGLTLALVCDAGWTPGRIVRDFLDANGLLEHLDFCAFSNEVGVPKPDPLIFRTALEAIGAEPAQAVHVGDLLRTDIFGARAMGMRSVRITEVNDDALEGFSWDPQAQLGYGKRAGVPADGVPFQDADEVIASHAELPAALSRLGAALG